MTVAVWVYRAREPEGFEVGFFDPAGNFCPEPVEFRTAPDAAARVSYLNGGEGIEARVLRSAARSMEQATILLREEARLLRKIREELGG